MNNPERTNSLEKMVNTLNEVEKTLEKVVIDKALTAVMHLEEIVKVSVVSTCDKKSLESCIAELNKANPKELNLSERLELHTKLATALPALTPENINTYPSIKELLEDYEALIDIFNYKIACLRDEMPYEGSDSKFDITKIIKWLATLRQAEKALDMIELNDDEVGPVADNLESIIKTNRNIICQFIKGLELSKPVITYINEQVETTTEFDATKQINNEEDLASRKEIFLYLFSEPPTPFLTKARRHRRRHY